MPLDVPGADFANFVGYILWLVCMLALATLILRRPNRVDPVLAPAHEFDARRSLPQ